MTYPDPRDRQVPPTRAYDGQYPPTQYGEQYPPTQYEQGQYEQPTQYAPRAAGNSPVRTPNVDPLMFAGGVVMTGVVTGLAAWLVAWVIDMIAKQVSANFSTAWNPLIEKPFWYALVGFLAALFGGALWYVLQMITPTPNSFYRWVVGLLITAAVVIPVIASISTDIGHGLIMALIHLCIGIPVLTLIPTMGAASRKKNARN